MDTITLIDHHILHLLQLASSALPVGAYSYSEGLETLVEQGVITNQKDLKHWLTAELRYGAIQLEAAVMLRGYQAVTRGDMEKLRYWNLWLSAARETQELRYASWQMGRSLMQLLAKIQPQVADLVNAVGHPSNYAIAFALAAAHWQIHPQAALLAYLHSWATNLITAGMKLIPLGQTAGQEILLQIQPLISAATLAIISLEDDDLSCCSWGLSLASMQHETQYTRLFRS